MLQSTELITQLSSQGILPLFFHADQNVCIKILNALFNAGIRMVEFTNRGSEALENFRHLKEVRDQRWPSLLLGAGTIKTREHAEAFIEAGADYIISPGLNEEVGRVVLEQNVLWVPGCMTPSEIMRAEAAGATLIKLFPGNLLGPEFVKSVKELFPSLKFIPTGGVQIEKANLSAWFRSGVVAVGAGSTLIDKKAIDTGDFDDIERRAKSALTLVNDIRNSLFP